MVVVGKLCSLIYSSNNKKKEQRWVVCWRGMGVCICRLCCSSSQIPHNWSSPNVSFNVSMSRARARIGPVYIVYTHISETVA